MGRPWDTIWGENAPTEAQEQDYFNRGKREWGIMRTGGVFSTVFGTHEEAVAYVNALNETDEQGSSEIITTGMTPEEASAWLAEVTR
jgi:hypothetical protein